MEKIEKSGQARKKIIVFGGDGFCGWPTSLRLSKEGHDVVIVDNLSRRKIDIDLGCNSLTPIEIPEKRIAAWKELTGREIKFINFNIAEEYDKLLALFKSFRPDTIIHFAEQRSAPYSMKSTSHKMYTVRNNLTATHNILCAIVDAGLDTHMIHLGTTGYYGYSSVGMEIPEGYLKVKVDVDGQEKNLEILYPPNPGSVYHTTKCQDALFFYFYNKNDGVRITDLHQGIVWGTQTPETNMDERLINRFDYGGDYGTVLNRFLMQTQVGHPMTIYGTGGQTRAFINIKDTTNCINLAVNNPPQKGERVRILNQTTECLNVGELAKKIQKLTGAEIKYYKNPRIESAKNDLKFSSKSFLEMGLDPITLDEGLLKEIMEIAAKYKDRCNKSKIISTSIWRKDLEVDFEGSSSPVEG